MRTFLSSIQNGLTTYVLGSVFAFVKNILTLLHCSVASARYLGSVGGLLVAASFVAIVLIGLSSPLSANAINEQFTFQGRLRNAAQGIVPDGDYHIRFKIYCGGDGALAGAGTGTDCLHASNEDLLWTETHTGGDVVRVENGYFTVQLNSVNDDLSGVDFAENKLWLSVEIGGSGGSPVWDDAELDPFMRFGSSPYAFQAKNSDTLDDLDSTDFVQLAQGSAQADATTNSSIFINKTGASGNILQLQNAGTDVLTLTKAGALTVTGSATIAGDLTVETGNQFTNAGSSLFTAIAITNKPSGGNIGTAAVTVDVASTFNVNQTTSGQTLTLPSPTDATGGRVVYVNNIGSQAFAMYGVTISSARSQAFIWNGTVWVSTNIDGAGNGVTAVGSFSTSNTFANGATIVANEIIFQSASATAPGMIDTAAQNFAGAKTFTGNVITDANTTLGDAAGDALTVNATSTFNEDITVATAKTLRITGGNVGSRPGSPSAGEIYYDTDTGALLKYDSAKSKWIADRGEYIVVAANDSSQAAKDAADYVADGTSDETEINLALDDADPNTDAAGVVDSDTQKVLLLAGTYVADGTILIPNNTTLAGVGRGTVIQLSVGTGTDNLIENSDTVTGVGVVIRDLTLDGSLGTAGTQAGIYLNGMGAGNGPSARQGAKLISLYANNFRNQGVFINNTDNSTITSVSANDNGTYGFYIDSSYNNTITGNTAQGGASRGFQLIGSDNNTFTGNTSQGNDYGLRFSSSHFNTVTGNTFYANTYDGLYIATSDGNTFSSNTITNSGDAAENNGIFLTSSDNNLISNNTITDDSCTTTCYAIDISDATSDKNYVANNYFTTSGADKATINDVGTGTIYGGQIEDETSGDFKIQPAGDINLIANTNITGELTVDGNFTFAEGANRTLSVAANATANGAGYNLSVAAGAADGTGTGNVGGILSLTGGAAAGSGNNNGGAVNINGGAGTGTGAQGAVNIQGTSGNVSIGNTAGASTTTIRAGTGGISLQPTGAGTVSISTGTQTGAVSIGTGTGVQTLSFGTGGTGAKTVTVGSTASTSSLTLNSGTGAINIGNGAQARTVNLGTGAAAQTVNVGSATTTSTTTIRAGTGGLNLGNNGVANTIQIGNTTGAVAQTVNVGNNATASSVTTLNIGSTIGASTTNINSGSGNINLTGAANVSGNLQVNGGNIGISTDTDLLQLASGALTVNGTISYTAGAADNDAVVCRNTASGQLATCNSTFLTASSVTLQVAYDGGNTIVATDAEGDIDLTVSEATNFSVDITGTGSFLVQNGGTNILTVGSAGTVAIGSGATPSTSSTLFLDRIATTTSGTERGVLGRIETTQDTISSAGQIGVSGLSIYNGTGTADGSFVGVQGVGRSNNTGTVAGLYGLRGQANNNSTGTITSAAGLFIESTLNPSGTITNNYGVYIQDQTVGTNNYALYTAGTAQSYFGGNVGIGVAVPSQRLAIKSSGTGTNVLRVINSADNDPIFNILENGSGNGVLSVYNSAGTESVQIHSNGNTFFNSGGNVGIGTATPNSDLSFGGDIARTIALEANSSNAIGNNLTIAAGTAGAGASAFAGGDLNLNGGAAAGTGNANGGDIVLQGGAGVGTGDYGDILLQNAGGNVGIGTNSPTEKLEVSGGNILATPTAPTALGSLDDTTDDPIELNDAVDVKVVGDYAYVTAEGDDGVSIINIADPNNPTLVSNVQDGGSFLLDGPQQLEVVGDYMYVASFNDSALEIVDISDPSSPSHVGSYSNTSLLDGATGIDIVGKYAYMTSYTDTSIVILDISDPTSPRLVGSFTDSNDLAAAFDISVTGNYAYIAAFNGNGGTGEVSIIDISDPTSPTSLSTLTIANAEIQSAWNLEVRGNYLYVAGHDDNALSIIDISDPTTPVEVGFLQDVVTMYRPYDIKLVGNFAYITRDYTTGGSDERGIVVVNITDPTNPTYVATLEDDGTTELERAYGFEVVGNYAYVANYNGADGGFQVLKLSGGITASQADIGSLQATNIFVDQSLSVGQSINSQSANIGSGGIQTQGALAVQGNSYLAGGISVGTTTNTSCAVNCTLNQANVDGNGAVIVDATASGLEVTLPDPTNGIAGKIVYVTAANGSNDFTLVVNGGGQGNEVTLKANTTATMIWNGSDWTAAGASSSTDLQAAYDNTATSAGGAELVLAAPGGAADGLTIRNNETTPITGGILEVQTSIGTNLFSVNNLGTELAANGGSENSSTWATNWEADGSASVARTTTSGEFRTGLAAAEVTTTAVANDGVFNNLSSNPTVSTTHTVSFTGKLDTGTFTTLEVVYSRDGGTDEEVCTAASGSTLITTEWTKITCTITTDGTTATNPDLIIRQTDATARTFWIDNLSMVQNDGTTEPSHVQIGGGISGGQVTLFTLDRASAPPVADGNDVYLGSMYYDTTSGRIQCYEADGWGACGSPPNNVITLTPEYAGAVLNGTGVGTMSADFCGNGGGVSVNTSFCASGEARNYYEWTSPQATDQTYSIYITYQLPSTFDSFLTNDTITLEARSTDHTVADVTYELFRSTDSAITECGTDTTVTTSTDAWQVVAHGADENTCSFAGGDRLIFKLNMIASDNEAVYVSDINFTFVNE